MTPGVNSCFGAWGKSEEVYAVRSPTSDLRGELVEVEVVYAWRSPSSDLSGVLVEVDSGEVARALAPPI